MVKIHFYFVIDLSKKFPLTSEHVSGRYVLLVGIAAYALNTSNFMHWHIIYTQQRKTRSYGTNIEQSPLMFVSVILENGK